MTVRRINDRRRQSDLIRSIIIDVLADAATTAHDQTCEQSHVEPAAVTASLFWLQTITMLRFAQYGTNIAYN